MPSRSTDSLDKYREKRSASETPEPFGAHTLTGAITTGKLFVVQQHAARNLHWDLRLEYGGVLKSWAVPKGPSLNPEDKRFAAHVEDHPIDYADFEGRIPDGNYGAGHVIVWDRGTYVELEDFASGFEKGKLLFEFKGHKLRGRFTLVQMKGRNNKGNEWLLIKEHDEWVSETYPPDDSIYSGLTVEEMEEPAKVGKRLTTRIRRLKPKPTQTDALSVKPMLARSGEPFDRKDWIFEIKYDGYRLMIEKDGEKIVLRSRNGHDLTAGFPELAMAAERMPFDQMVIDGEVVVHDERGIPSFSLLQQRARLRGEIAVNRAAIHQPVTYYSFDLLQAQHYDLRELPLTKRKELLASVLPSAGPIRFSDHIAQHGRQVFDSMTGLGLEGVVGKRADSTYRSGRSDDWIKVRAQRTGDFVLAGWTPNKSNADDIGAIVVAEYRGDQLVYTGRVGSGLGGAARAELVAAMADLGTGTPLADGDKYNWVEPKLVVEVAYKEYTRDGFLRHPVYQRIRFDKQPVECVSVFDDPTPVEIQPVEEHVVEVTNRKKVFFPEKELTKGDLVDYYEAVAPWMLPYLIDRPLVLTRFPDGIHGKSFYQRNAPDFVPDWVKRETLWSESEEREESYFLVQDAASLKYLANMGAIPIHAWHSRISDLEHPDWCVLDLDPKAAPFSDVVEVAKMIRDLLEEIDLPGFLKSSGASGLHILIPLERKLTHSQSRTLGELLARVIVQRRNDICTITRSVRKRDNKVYIDYMQNGHGQLLVAPLSVRAEPAASVSMPLKWSELNGRLSNSRFHIKNAINRLKRNGDPMLPLLTTQTDLEGALTRLGALLNGD